MPRIAKQRRSTVSGLRTEITTTTKRFQNGVGLILELDYLIVTIATQFDFFLIVICLFV